MSQTISLTLPQSTYDRLTAVAEAADSSLEEVLLQTIKNGMPPSLQKVPADFHPLLLALHKFEDPALWEVVDGTAADLPDVSDKNAGFETLRRAYAYALLKWRGHPVPDPAEILL
jgi:hypothetical protein